MYKVYRTQRCRYVRSNQIQNFRNNNAFSFWKTGQTPLLTKDQNSSENWDLAAFVPVIYYIKLWAPRHGTVILINIDPTERTKWLILVPRATLANIICQSLQINIYGVTSVQFKEKNGCQSWSQQNMAKRISLYNSVPTYYEKIINESRGMRQTCAVKNINKHKNCLK